jgi:phage terminase Nu1 subunit (DNA packaging protein)
MKIENLKLKISDTSAVEVGRWLGLTIDEITAHAASGILVRAKQRGHYRLQASVTAYCAHVRSEASGREAPMALERRRLLKGQADFVELKTKFESGEMLDAAVVESEWSITLRMIRSLMMATPTRIAATVCHLDRHEVSEIDLEVRAVLTEAAEDHT